MKKLLILALSLLMAASMVACGSDVQEETFEASASGFGGEVTVKVTFKGEDITKVEVSGPNETSGIGSNAVEQLPAKIEEADSADVDVVSGATITSEAIKSAVRKAIKLKNGETDSGISFTAGTYTATVKGYRGEITGEVTFDETSIVSVNVTNCGDTLGIAYGTKTTPVEALTAKIVETQSLGVDTVVGATVSSNAIIAMVADAAAQAGADVDALKAVAVAKEEAKDVTYDVDIVVVGGGAAGLTAGISALEEGASVLIVEKQGITGGSTARSGGKVLAAGTDLMTEYNMDNNPDLLYDYLMEVGQDFINEDLLKPFVYGSADNLDYLSQHGVVFEDVEAVHSNLPIWWVHNTLGLSGMTDGHGGRISV
ncbi:MAG: FAD-dependent oxidoreductase, partial [Erysipelotrichaceae bacterium]|nr:FAD-dependent oxidoreductase [Erysipelotrichaceae bacterium]